MASAQLRLQVVVATEDVEGRVTDFRKFLHITLKTRDISSFVVEVDEKFKRLYPTERH